MAAEVKRENGDAALLRRTRLRLLAWSGGLTLVILVALGAALYIAVSGSLAARGTDLLASRADGLVRLLQRPGQIPAAFVLGPGFGGESSGTLALIVRPDDTLVGPAELQDISGLPDPAGVTAARAGATDVRQIEVSSIPVRVYSIAVTRPDGAYVVQVLGERSSEVQLLSTLLSVLALGGLAALLLALAAGYVYAGRALIPVRASMDRRDVALRRQREFTANASHELRTPLAILKAELDLALSQERSATELRAALASASEETDRLTQLAEDLLTIAQTDQGELPVRLAPTDVGQVLNGVARRFSRRAEESDRAIEVRVEPGLEVAGDRMRLDQALGNLLDNALRYGSGPVSLTAIGRNGSVELHVSDRGPGFADDFLDRALERFSRADASNRDGGSGLGLSIVASIARAHRGEARVANREGGGADVWLTLPAGRQ